MTSEISRWRYIVGALAPLPVVAASVALDLNPWIAFVALAIVIGLAAEFLGTLAGVVGALVAATGFVLVIEEETARRGVARGGPELAALAVLLILAALFGHDRLKAS